MLYGTEMQVELLISPTMVFFLYIFGVMLDAGFYRAINEYFDVIFCSNNFSNSLAVAYIWEYECLVAMVPVRFMLENPRPEQGPCLRLSPSKTSVEWPVSWNFFKWWVMVNLLMGFCNMPIKPCYFLLIKLRNFMVHILCYFVLRYAAPPPRLHQVHIF